MCDDWEDWESEDYVVPALSVPNEEQLKRLEERRLVEESDNALSKDLFSTDEKDLVFEDLKQIENKFNSKPLQSTEKKAPKEKLVSNKQLNEQKQKELSKKIKEEKERKKRENEIYGGDEYYEEYGDYEDKFY